MAVLAYLAMLLSTRDRQVAWVEVRARMSAEAVGVLVVDPCDMVRAPFVDVAVVTLVVPAVVALVGVEVVVV